MILSLQPVQNALGLENFFTDLMYQLKFTIDKPSPPDNIVIVDIDDKSLWLLERPDYLADLIQSISGNDGAEVIGLDILFDDLKNPDPANSNQKKLALTCPYDPNKHPYEMKLACTFDSEQVGNIVLGIAYSLKDKLEFIYPVNALKQSAWGVGLLHIPADEGEVSFKKSLVYVDNPETNRPLLSFPLAIVSYITQLPDEFTGNDLLLGKNNIKVYTSTDNNTSAILQSFTGMVNPSLFPAQGYKYFIPQLLGPGKDFKYIKATDLINKMNNKKFLKRNFKGKIVLFGSSSALLQDLKTTPFTRFNLHNGLQGQMPGIEFHANSIYSILNNKFYHPAPFILYLIWGLLFISSALILKLHYKKLLAVILPLILVIFQFVCAFLAFYYLSIIIPASTVGLSMLMTLPLAYAYKFFKINKIFGRYVSPDVAELIWQNRNKIRLDGDKKIATVVFTDIRGFTTLSEKSDPAFILRILNRYFEEMAKIIYDNGGNLNKFIGDGLMILYGVPVSTGSPHADACNAIKSAILMIDAVKMLNLEWQKDNPDFEINIGVGIHTGEIIVGNIGSHNRLEYSALGDTVNLSARLEGVNKEFKTNIIISADTYNLVKDHFNLKHLGEISVKGRAQLVSIFTVEINKEILS